METLKTVAGEGMSNLGGSSKHLGNKSGGLEKGTRAVDGLGFPGTCSHRNGTDAKVSSGGVAIPDLSVSGDCMENKGSLAMLLCSSPILSPTPQQENPFLSLKPQTNLLTPTH